jgi:hypothetical protein
MATSYCDFDFYTSTFLGRTIAEADFPRLALLASVSIDLLTYNRAKAVAESDTETTEKIQLAVCAVAEILQKLEASGGVVQSESVGRASVTYANPQSQEAQAYKAAKTFLWDTGLMYRGLTETER